MKGVMLKSLYNLKRPFNIVLFVFLVMFSFGVDFLVLKSPAWYFDKELLQYMTFEPIYLEFWLIAGLISLILTARSLDPLMTDESEKWNRYCDVTPMGRAKYILSYYILMTCMNFLFSCLMSLIPLNAMLFVKERYGNLFDIQDFILGFIIIFAAGQIMLSLGIFAISNFGRLGIALIFVLFGIIVMVMMSVGMSFNLDEVVMNIGDFIGTDNRLLISLGVLLIAAAFTAAGYFLTVQLYKSKELG